MENRQENESESSDESEEEQRNFVSNNNEEEEEEEETREENSNRSGRRISKKKLLEIITQMDEQWEPCELECEKEKNDYLSNLDKSERYYFNIINRSFTKNDCILCVFDDSVERYLIIK